MSKLETLARAIVFAIVALVVHISNPHDANAQDGGQMYLVEFVATDAGSFDSPEAAADMLEGAIIPSLEALANDPRVLAGGLPLAARAGVCIVRAGSHDEVTAMFRALPGWPLMRWDVTPLESFQARADMEKKIVGEIRAMKK